MAPNSREISSYAHELVRICEDPTFTSDPLSYFEERYVITDMEPGDPLLIDANLYINTRQKLLNAGWTRQAAQARAGMAVADQLKHFFHGVELLLGTDEE